MLNKKIDLVEFNLYEYDFEACFYNIIKNLNSDLIKNINYENKDIRNKQIGLLQKKHPDLAELLIKTTDGLLSFYIKKNNLNENDIVWKQRDGFISKKKLEDTSSSMPIKFKGYIPILISDIKKQRCLIIYENNTVITKGVKNKLQDMSFFQMFSGLNYYNSLSVLNGIEMIRYKIFKSDNVHWFSREVDGFLYIPIKNNGVMKFNNSSINNFNINNIDRKITWNNYVWPFAQSLLDYYGSINNATNNTNNTNTKTRKSTRQI
jgi:hypothetical protein